jgi:hypothetical protein
MGALCFIPSDKRGAKETIKEELKGMYVHSTATMVVIPRVNGAHDERVKSQWDSDISVLPGCSLLTPLLIWTFGHSV